MSTREPWHLLSQNVHHVHSDCPQVKDAERIQGSHRTGDGGKPLCPECAKRDAPARPDESPPVPR